MSYLKKKDEKESSTLSTRRQDKLQRQKYVRKLYLKGTPPSDIREKTATKYKVHPGTVDNDLVEVKKSFKAYLDKTAPAIVGRHMQYYYDMYQEARENGDLNTAIKTLNSVENLFGIKRDNPVVNFQQNNLNLKELSDDQLLKLKEIITSNPGVIQSESQDNDYIAESDNDTLGGEIEDVEPLDNDE